MKSANELSFQETVEGLIAGDFSRLAPLFDSASNAPCPIIVWYEAGLFANEPKALEEAFTCACFNGKMDVVQYLLAKQVGPSGGNNTGLNAVHWAANRGQLDVVKLLLSHNVNLETRNMYGGTVLGATVWASANETRPTHPEIVAALIDAGADLSEADFPSGNRAVDEILQRHLSNQADTEIT